jgi:hypothetical protein
MPSRKTKTPASKVKAASKVSPVRAAKIEGAAPALKKEATAAKDKPEDGFTKTPASKVKVKAASKVTPPANQAKAAKIEGAAPALKKEEDKPKDAYTCLV